MGSASRAALAAARGELSPVLGAGVGAELLGAAAELDRTPALLKALGDASASAAAKGQLVDRVFASVSGGARGVLRAAAAGTWSDSGEFVEGIEELGIRAEANASSSLSDELLAAASVVESSHELELKLGDKLGDPAAKVALATRLFGGKLSAAALGIVTHLVANPRGRRVNAALRAAADVAADQGGNALATVTVAAPLAPAQQQRLAVLLEQSAGRPVRITTVLDPELVGGVRVQLGDNVIDGSVRARLEDLRLRLAG